VSRASQLSFLEKLDKEMSRNSSDYRKNSADYRAHSFTVTRRGLRRAIALVLENQFIDISKGDVQDIQKLLDPVVKKLIKHIGKEIQRISKKDPSVRLHKYSAATIVASFDAKNTSRYAKIYGVYKQQIKIVASAFNKSVTIVLGKKSNLAAGEVFNLEHGHLQGIVESQVRDAIDNAVLEDSERSKSMVMSFFKKRGVDLKVVRDTKADTMNVFIGSAVDNINEGGISKNRKAKLQRELKKAITELQEGGYFLTLKGSDSFKDIKEKQATAAVLNSFKGKKGHKVSKSPSIKHSKTTTKKTKNKKGAVVSPLLKKKKLRKAKRSTGVASTPLQLIASLNKALPSAVRDNMKEPGLVNRTGRFAASVHVTDVMTTKTGLPSIGYTYDRDPYEVFEAGSGTRFSSTDRDPRKIIDKSIREIATKMAIGRFFTRRT